MTARFAPDEDLLLSAGTLLRTSHRLRFLTGGAGAGKTAIAGAIASRLRVRVLDMDERIYGSWSDRWDRRRHPTAWAWISSADPLAMQLAMDQETFLGFQRALAVEELDLLAAELQGEPVTGGWTLVDGGFGSLAVLASAVPAAHVACVAAADTDSRTVWAGNPGRRAFLDAVSSVESVDAPVERFLALDAALTAGMLAEAEAAGVAIVRRRPAEPVWLTADRVIAVLGMRGA